ncbi:prolyl oligopeptidase family serine peptidase [Flexithrix dorotheae]|uniref:carboxylesterase family protein n=1 Tax=Flexithrix dorotheae TaxID=70993 RepID=UPI0003682678|nr:prolyl oligopeptidase family serine peptidase [Flexithrix dorotheae]
MKTKINLTGSFLFVFLLSFGLNAQDFSLFEKFEFNGESGGKMPYRLLKPLDYNPEKSYPLVVFLHGSGERGDDNEAQLQNGLEPFLETSNRDKYPAFVLVPQCPKDMKWAKTADPDDIAFTFSEEPTEPMKILMETIAQVQHDFKIDERRLYLTGLSMGGYGTFDLLTRRPDMFAAAVVVCGAGDVRMVDRFKDVPLWIFHGEDDDAVPSDLSKVMVNALTSVGAKPKYTLYPEVGHNSWDLAYNEEKLFPWLFKKKK